MVLKLGAFRLKFVRGQEYGQKLVTPLPDLVANVLERDLVGPEGPSVRKRTVRNENTDENPTISTGRRRFCCGAGTNWPFVACNHGVQMPLDAACATAKDSCTQ